MYLSKQRSNKKIPTVQTDCQLCSLGVEDLDHLFLNCNIARLAWFGCSLCIHIDRINPRTVQQWMTELLLSGSGSTCQGCMISCISLHRNIAVTFKGVEPNPRTIIHHYEFLSA